MIRDGSIDQLRAVAAAAWAHGPQPTRKPNELLHTGRHRSHKGRRHSLSTRQNVSSNLLADDFLKLFDAGIVALVKRPQSQTDYPNGVFHRAATRRS
jgi:hypothetical protein